MKYFKKWEDLTITDDFMFCKVMQDENICRKLLEILLHIKIGKLNFQEPQKSIQITGESRGIRLDVYAADSDRVFDIELQTTDERNLELRTRYYQGVMDIDELARGSNFQALKESYIIFICTFDPFGNNLPIYTVRQTFDENSNLIFDDKTHKIYYNASAFGKITGDTEIKAFLEYLCKNNVTSEFTASLDSAVNMNKGNQHWRKEYMTLAYDMAVATNKARELGRSEGREEGRKEGIAIGEERGRQKGISLGISQGAREAKLETAKSMKHENMPIPMIAHFTGLSIEEIDKL